MIERRITNRTSVDMTVKRNLDGDSFNCRVCEISPTGIRLRRKFFPDDPDCLIEIELPLVPGELTTALNCRRVWRKGPYEAFEFVNPSFAQRTLLERLFGHC